MIENAKTKRNIILITGHSGAGLSSVLKTLEDFGMEVLDNFPLTLIPALLADTSAGNRDLALGVDSRSRGFSAEAVLKAAQEMQAKLVFITCDSSILQRRFSETRRRHPLARQESLRTGITQEQELLQPLKKHADLIIDTSDLRVPDLRHILQGHFKDEMTKQMTVTFMSFGYKHGLPREADIVMDIRFLKNPYWEEKLRTKTGLDSEVGAYIEQDPDYAAFIKHFRTLIEPLLPRYKQEGKTYLTIAIGCTGGQHRSVYTVEKLCEWINGQDVLPNIEHRDLKIQKP